MKKKYVKICKNCKQEYQRDTQNDWQWAHKFYCDAYCRTEANNKRYKTEIKGILKWARENMKKEKSEVIKNGKKHNRANTGIKG